MQLKTFSALLLSVANEAGASQISEWSSPIMVTDDEGATETYKVVFALDADFYVVGSGDDMEEIFRLEASVHVDHPDPFGSILTEIEQGTCFELPEDVLCTVFHWTAENSAIKFYVSTGADAYLGRVNHEGDDPSVEFELEYVGYVYW